MKANCLIGIDPGAAGGIAVQVAGELTVKTIKMPKDNADLAALFRYYAENYSPVVFLEKVNMRRDDLLGGGNMGKIYRMQAMLANYEHLKALMDVSGIPFVQVHPATWQSKLGIRRNGEEKRDRKRRYAELAGELYGIKATLWNADAVLIMHFGKYALENEKKWVREQLPKVEFDKLFD